MKEYYGIDVSSYNETPDWSKVTGVSFAILRVTQKYGIDSSFEHNYAGATKHGIKVGVYKYSYARTPEESRKEAETVVQVLNGRHLDFPVVLDLEWEEQTKLNRATMGLIIEEFKAVIESAGYSFLIYTTDYWVKNFLPTDAKDKYHFWLASVPYDKYDDGSLQERLRPSWGIGWQYSWKGKVPGIATAVDMDVFYTDFSGEEDDFKMAVTADTILSKARSWVGRNEADGSHKAIIDIYNSYKPRARGYKVQYTDQWCDTCVSALFIACNAVDLIGGTECGVEEHTKLFKAAGIWIEDGTITPKPGDIIVFNWDTTKQPNDGYSDHIGIVESVSNGTITTIEGNYKDSVARRKLQVGNGQIRGYARPKYGVESKPEPAPEDPKKVEEELKSMKLETVKLGSTCESVTILQKVLNCLGNRLTVDGQFGVRTYAAVTSFQNTSSLVLDGVVGPATWAALKTALADLQKMVNEVAKEFLSSAT